MWLCVYDGVMYLCLWRSIAAAVPNGEVAALKAHVPEEEEFKEEIAGWGCLNIRVLVGRYMGIYRGYHGIYIYQWVDDRMTSLWLFNITEHGWAWPIEIDDFWWLMYRSAKMLVFQFATLNYEKVTSKHSQQRGCTWICISLSNWRRWSVVFNPVMNAI